MSSPMTRRDLEARIIAKAWRDPDYKKRLESDPKAVLAEELKSIDPSIDLPDALSVQVHEEDANTFHLVLPRDPRDLKLSDVVPDDALEAVAPQTIAVVVVGVAVVAGNTVGVGNNVGAVNAAVAGNVATTGNAVANTNTVS